jgi:hypothetical protein
MGSEKGTNAFMAKNVFSKSNAKIRECFGKPYYLFDEFYQTYVDSAVSLQTTVYSERLRQKKQRMDRKSPF